MKLPHPPEAHQQARSRRSSASADLTYFLGAAEDERSRILTAVARLTLSGGSKGLTISRVRAQAGASRRGFHSHFASVDECLLEAAEAIARSAVARAHVAARCGDGRVGVPDLVEALCADAIRNPALAKLVLADVEATGREGRDRAEQLTSLASGHLQPPASAGERVSLALEASVAAAWRIAQSHTLTAAGSCLAQLAPLIARIVTVPQEEIKNIANENLIVQLTSWQGGLVEADASGGTGPPPITGRAIHATKINQGEL